MKMNNVCQTLPGCRLSVPCTWYLTDTIPQVTYNCAFQGSGFQPLRGVVRRYDTQRNHLVWFTSGTTSFPFGSFLYTSFPEHITMQVLLLGKTCLPFSEKFSGHSSRTIFLSDVSVCSAVQGTIVIRPACLIRYVLRYSVHSRAPPPASH